VNNAERSGTQNRGFVSEELFDILDRQLSQLTLAECRNNMRLSIYPVHFYSVRITSIQPVCKPVGYSIADGISGCRCHHSIVVGPLDFLELVFRFGLGSAASPGLRAARRAGAGLGLPLFPRGTEPPMGRQANPKGLDLGLASDCPGRAFSHSGGKFASLAAGHRAGDRVDPERSHADRRSTSTLTASSRIGIYPRGARRPGCDPTTDVRHMPAN
jgi:hypothetical protein